MSGLLAGISLVDAGAAAAARAAADADAATERKERKRREKSERKRARRERRLAREGGDAKRARSASSAEEEEEEPPSAPAVDAAREAAGLAWMSNEAHARPEAAPQPPPAQLAAEAAEAARAARVASLELNPHWREGREGVPPATAAPAAPPAAACVGDGGVSWRLKALRRAQERAAEEGRSLDAVVEERWGALAGLAGDAARQPAAHARAHARAAAERRAGGGSDYLRDLGREAAEGRRMRPPPGAPRAAEAAREQARVLGAAARSINAFASDGSFFDAASGGPRAADAPAPPPLPPPPPPPSPLPSPADAEGGQNASAAAALRARLTGRAAPAPPAPRAAPEPPAAPEAELLPLVSADGRAAEGAFGRTAAAAGGDPHRRPAKLQRFEAGGGGARARYYADDDGRGLAELVAAEKHGAGALGNAGDANLARHVARAGARWTGKELDADAEYDHDGGLELFEARRALKGRAPAEEAERAKRREVQSFQRSQLQLAACPLCFAGGARPRGAHVAYGRASYLQLPESGRLAPGHAQLAPMAHGGSQRSCDEDVYEELRNFKKCLLRMHVAAGAATVVFIETHLGGGGGGALGRHCLLDAVPLPPSVAAAAPLFFRKAIDEAESEWSTHDAKKCIALGGAGGKALRNAIPPAFPYFLVEFGLASGFVHVIDEPAKWNPHFGRDVLIGLLDLPGELTRQRARKLSPAEMEAQRAEFLKAYEPFDWTKQLD